MIEKIRKLLALAMDPAASPNEAETAARQAAALMRKHDLTLTEVEARSIDWDLTEQSMTGARPGKKDAQMVPPWIGFLAVGVDEFTKTIVFKRDPQVVFQGPREDVVMAQWMLSTLIEMCYRASSPNAFRNSYALAIQHRLKALTEAVDRESTGTSLIVQSSRDQAMLARFGRIGPKPGKAKRFASSVEGSIAGSSASIPTNRPVQRTALK